MRHLLDVDDLDGAELAAVLDRATSPSPPAVLAGKGMALLFEKPSARTRNSMEMAVVQLGGHPLTIRGEEVGFDVRETVEDIGRTLACYHAAIGARVFDHSVVERLAAAAGVPVVNMLSDRAHPLQALADLLTARQHFGSLAGRTVAWVGDGNNVCRSLALGAALAGMPIRICTPEGFDLPEQDLDRIRGIGGMVELHREPRDAVAGADLVSTDVWTSMGQEGQAADRRQAFAGYCVTEELMARAGPGAVFLHCLPAHRGEEVTAEVVDGPRSLVWAQAANRMHAARGLLTWLLEGA